MLLFTLTVLLLIIAALIFIKKSHVSTSYGETKTYNLRPWSTIPLVLALVTLVFSTVYTQDPGEALVLKSFSGKVNGIDSTSGLGVTTPWNSIISFNIRNQRIEMFDDKGSGPGKDGTAIVAPLEGSSNARVSITLRYSIKAACVGNVYSLHKDQQNLEDNVIKPKLRDITRQETAKFGPLAIKENRGELGAAVTKSLENALSNDCVIVDNIDLGAIDLDEGTEKAITERNARQLQVESARADLERASIEAESTKVRAQADADADQIVRCGATTVETTKTVAGKEVASTVVVPKEGAACEERLNQQVLYSKWLDALTKVGEAGNTILVVPEGQANQMILQAPQTGR